MFLALLLTVIGSSFGGILALGTAWAGVKRYIQRSLARHLADVIPRDMSTAIVLARNHEGKEKAQWICDILRKSVSISLTDTSVLDLAGGTHFDLIEALIPKVNSVDVYDGKVALQYLAENRVNLLTSGKVALKEGENLIGKLSSFADTDCYDVVLAIDILHVVHPDFRHDVVREWTRLVKPNGGFIVVVFEVEPLSSVSQAGVLQGIFFRTNHVLVRGLLETQGLTLVEIYEYPSESKVAIIAKKGFSSIQ